MKTADLTLEDELLKSGVNKYGTSIAIGKHAIIKAMEAYATQQTAELTAQLEKERKDKEGLLAEIENLKEYIKSLEKYTTKIQN